MMSYYELAMNLDTFADRFADDEEERYHLHERALEEEDHTRPWSEATEDPDHAQHVAQLEQDHLADECRSGVLIESVDDPSLIWDAPVVGTC
jgi:hypothetical protein